MLRLHSDSHAFAMSQCRLQEQRAVAGLLVQGDTRFLHATEAQLQALADVVNQQVGW